MIAWKWPSKPQRNFETESKTERAYRNNILRTFLPVALKGMTGEAGAAGSCLLAFAYPAGSCLLLSWPDRVIRRVLRGSLGGEVLSIIDSSVAKQKTSNSSMETRTGEKCPHQQPRIANVSSQTSALAHQLNRPFCTASNHAARWRGGQSRGTPHDVCPGELSLAEESLPSLVTKQTPPRIGGRTWLKRHKKQLRLAGNVVSFVFPT